MKLMPNDLLDETRVVNPRNQYPAEKLKKSVGYDPDIHQIKKYSEEDVDKIIAILTLFIDDSNTRIAVEEVYQSLKETGKI